MRFDAAEPGTPAATWLADGRLAALPEVGLPGGGVLVLAAHPDDETLGTGHLVAELALRGRAPEVVVVTDGAVGVARGGDGGAPVGRVDGAADGAADDGGASGADRALATRRAAEVREAVALLTAGGVDPILLGHPDGGVREVRDEVAAWLEDHLDERERAGRPVTTIVSTWRGDGHRDHRVLGEIAAEVAQRRGLALWEYPIWLWHWADPDSPEVPWARLRRLPVSGEASARRARALDAHASQVAGVGALVPHDLRRVTGRGEDVFVVTGAPTVPGPDTATQAVPSDVPPAFFDDTYRRRDDPWGFTTRWYEERKRALTLAALPRPRFARAWEIGCSIGVLTEQLARRCSALLAVDVAERAVELARERLAGAPGVHVTTMDVTREVPEGTFDLVVLSEVLYYLAPDSLRALLHRVDDVLTDDGVVLACHWRHPVVGYAAGGDEVHRVLAAHLPLVRVSRYEDEDLVLDVLTRDGRSVAAREGLL